MEQSREKLVRAALELFEEKGFAATSVEDIADRAQVGRTTLFRRFGSKEGLVFPDHDSLLGRAEDRLAAACAETMPSAIIDVASSVFDYYLGEGDLAQMRYRLTRSVPALRDYETATVSRYVRLFARYLLPTADSDTLCELRAELFSHAVVAAHNAVLRRWLRGEAQQPRGELAEAMTLTLPILRPDRAPTSAVVVLSTSWPIDSVLPQIQAAIQDRI